MAGTTWNIFAPNTKIRSSEMNENFDWLEGNLEPMNAGSLTDGAYDLGTSANRWSNAYLYNCNVITGIQFATSASESPYRIVYDTSAIHCYGNGNDVANFNSLGLHISHGYRLSLDGGGDTFIDEATANTIHFHAGNTTSAYMNNQGLIMNISKSSPSEKNGIYKNNIVQGWANFGYISSTLTTQEAFNVSSIQRNSQGIYTITWSNVFAGNSYCVVGVSEKVSGNTRIFAINTQTANNVQIVITDVGANVQDAEKIHIMAVGVQ